MSSDDPLTMSTRNYYRILSRAETIRKLDSTLQQDSDQSCGDTNTRFEEQGIKKASAQGNNSSSDGEPIMNILKNIKIDDIPPPWGVVVEDSEGPQPTME